MTGVQTCALPIYFESIQSLTIDLLNWILQPKTKNSLFKKFYKLSLAFFNKNLDRNIMNNLINDPLDQNDADIIQLDRKENA